MTVSVSTIDFLDYITFVELWNNLFSWVKMRMCLESVGPVFALTL